MSEINLVLLDRLDCDEVFSDSPEVLGWSRDNVVHLELRTIRPDVTKPGEPQSGKVSPVARLAMTIPVAIALQATLAHHLTELEKQGVVKRTAPLPNEAKH